MIDEFHSLLTRVQKQSSYNTYFRKFEIVKLDMNGSSEGCAQIGWTERVKSQVRVARKFNILLQNLHGLHQPMNSNIASIKFDLKTVKNRYEVESINLLLCDIRYTYTDKQS